tara:strand:- start:1050 stop:1577 length:528 start_codon:yes stop_codon:yes gene_type:complete
MSKKKTSTFYLTERLTVTSGATEVTSTIDLGAYVDVADRQGIAVEAVDFIFQGTTADERIVTALGADGDVFAQVSDLNRGGTIQFADDRALVASGTLTVDSNNIMSNQTDMYPDLFGAKDGVRIVVNDQLYLTALSTAVATSKAVNVTVRIKAHVCTLTAKDWMAIAIQSTAADN